MGHHATKNYSICKRKSPAVCLMHDSPILELDFELVAQLADRRAACLPCISVVKEVTAQYLDQSVREHRVLTSLTPGRLRDSTHIVQCPWHRHLLFQPIRDIPSEFSDSQQLVVDCRAALWAFYVEVLVCIAVELVKRRLKRKGDSALSPRHRYCIFTSGTLD